MKTPLEKQLEQAYQIFNKDHEHLREKILNSVTRQQVEPEPEKKDFPVHKNSGPSLGEIVMKNKILKIAAGIIIAGIIAIALKFFTGTGTVTSIAFGEVLNQIHSRSYTFDVTTISEGKTQGAGKCMILQPGLMRYDTPDLMGGFTSIANLNTNESIIIFHGQKTVINMKEYLKTQGITNEFGPLTMFSNPVENLWNLQDGTQTSLGEKEIDGQNATGFKVHQEDEKYPSDIIVWANNKTGAPIRVEINFYNPENPSESMNEVMSNFNLNATLDEKLFSMKPPEGYTMAYQKTLEDTVQKGELTPEAKKIQESIKLWSSGEQDKAISTILSVDWTQNFNFTGDMYLLSMTEKGYVQLKPDDQQKVIEEINKTGGQIRQLCLKLWTEAQEAVTKQDYAKAEKYLTTTLEFGRMINRNSEIALTVKLIGYALQQKSLTEMTNLYKISGQQEKLQQAQENLEKIKTERETTVKPFQNN